MQPSLHVAALALEVSNFDHGDGTVRDWRNSNNLLMPSPNVVSSDSKSPSLSFRQLKCRCFSFATCLKLAWREMGALAAGNCAQQKSRDPKIAAFFVLAFARLS